MGPAAGGHGGLASARAAADHPRCGSPAEAGLGGSNGGIFAMSVNHVQPHLVVGDVKAGQYLIPQFRDESDACPGRSRPPDRTYPRGENAPPGLDALRSGYALATAVQPRRIL